MRFILIGASYMTLAILLAKFINYRLSRPVRKPETLADDYDAGHHYVNHDGVYSFSDN